MLSKKIFEQGEMNVEDVFDEGRLPSEIIGVEASSKGPPRALMLLVPCEEGEYPLLLFLHGYFLQNAHYTQLLQHVASHGYIVIAPQMESSLFTSDATGEIKDAVAVTEWLRTGITDHLPEKVRPNLEKVAIAGHSRGGKVAFGAALGKTAAAPSSPYVALLGIDPVDGKSRSCPTQPQILSYEEHSFPGNIPTLVVGSGLGPLSAGVMCPCAPSGVNHVEFFRECDAPAYHFVAVEYGHMDMLDDKTDGLVGSFSYCACKRGDARRPMRRFCGGIMVAFLNAWVKRESQVLDELFINPSSIPLKVERQERYI